MLNIFLKLTRPVPASLVSLALTGLWSYLGKPGLLVSPEATLSNSAVAVGILAQIAATMLGFMMAVLAILASINNTRLVRNLKRTGHFHRLLAVIFYGNVGLSLVTIISLLVAFRPDFLSLIAPYLLLTCLFTALVFSGTMVMLWKVLAHLKPVSTQVD